MNIKMNAVSIMVLSSLSVGMPNAYAGFNETPYVSYLSGEDFDAAFSIQQQVAAPKPSDSLALIRKADTSKGTVDVKRNADSQAGIVTQNIMAKLITKAPAPAETMSVEAPDSPSCPADEIGYIAPCL